MRALHAAELRGSWQAWLSVCLVFVTVGFALGLPFLMIDSAQAFSEGQTASANLSVMALLYSNVVLCVPVALLVIGATTQLVIASRRGSIARLALAGATPRQVTATLMVQLVVVSTLATIIGLVIAIIVQPGALQMVSGDRASEGYRGIIPAIIEVKALLQTIGVSVTVAVLGGWRQARKATTIPPVEALRQSTNDGVGRQRRSYLGRWIGTCLVVVMAIALAAGVLWVFPRLPFQKGDLIMQAGFMVLMLLVWAASLATPMILGPLTRLWTSLVPAKNIVWHLTRHTMIAKSERLARSVIPLMLSLCLPICFFILGESFNGALRHSGAGFQLEKMSLQTFVLVLGAPFGIALSGAVSNLIMMARARDAELALNGLAGATPIQQRLTLLSEGMMIFISALMIGLIPATGFSIFLTNGMKTAYHYGVLHIPWSEVAIVMLVIFLIVVVATVLPSLPSLGKPAPRVIAKLIAD